MLSPETLFFEVKNKATERSEKWKNVDSEVTNRFNIGAMTSMRFFLPNCSIVPNQLKLTLATDTQFYQVHHHPGLLSNLIFSKDFVRIFLTQGHLWIQSVINGDEYFILNSGKLWMFLNKSTVETLECIEANVYFINECHTLLELDMQKILDSEFSAKTALKWRESLKRVEHLFEQPWKLSWQPLDENTCPSSIAKFFHDNGAKIEEIEAFIATRRVKTNSIPQFPLEESEHEEMLDETEIDFDLYEDWMGKLILSNPGKDIGYNDSFLTLVEAEGMFTFHDLQRSIQAVRDIIKDGWALASITPSATACILKQSNMKIKQFSFATNTLLITKDSIFARSKRGSL